MQDKKQETTFSSGVDSLLVNSLLSALVGLGRGGEKQRRLPAGQSVLTL